MHPQILRRIACAAISFCLLVPIASAQYPGWTMFDDATVTDITETTDGLWVATSGSGLFHVDRTTGGISQYSKVTSKIHDNVINSIAADSAGRIWTATRRGLAMFDRTQWHRYENLAEGIEVPNLTSIAVDSDGAVWAASRVGLLKFDGARWTVFDSSDYNVPDNEITVVEVAPDGSVWAGIGTSWFNERSYGAIRYSLGQWTSFKASNSPLSDEWVTSISIGRDGLPWFGTGRMGRVVHFDGALGHSYDVPPPPGGVVLGNTMVYSVLEASNGDLWAGSNAGFFRRTNGEWSRQVGPDSALYGRNPVFAIHETSGNEIVIGSSAGLMKSRAPFVEWEHVELARASLRTNRVTAMFADRDGSMLAAVAGNEEGIRRFRDGMWMNMMPDSVATLINNFSSVRNFSRDSSGNLWIALATGIARYDGANWIFISRDSLYSHTTPLTAIITAANGNVIVAGNGLRSFDGERFTSIPVSPPGGGFVEPTALAIGRDSALWVGFNRSGLGRLHNGEWTFWNTDNSGIGSNNVTALAVDNDGSIWAGTDRGLVHLVDDKVAVRYTTLTTPIVGAVINTIAIGKDGALWVGTNGSLSRFDGTSWMVFTANNSPLSQPNITSIAIDDAGNIWAGSYYDGIVVYDGRTVSGVAPARTSTAMQVTLAPNPAHDYVRVTGLTGRMIILSTLGAVVFDGFVGADGFVALPQMAAGVYFVSVGSAEAVMLFVK